jgi:outer membrane protein assembly factor BamB
MRTWTAWTAGLAAGAALAAATRASPTQDAKPDAGPLAVLEPLAAHKWVAPFPNGRLTDTQRFEWMYGRKFLRNPHQVKDASGKVVYEGETIYGFDEATGAVRWWYFNATGGFIEGTVVEEPDGTLVFEGENHAAKQQTAKVRSTSLVDGDAWRSTTWFWKDGEWKPERELRFAPQK